MLRTTFVLFVIIIACFASDPPKKEKKIHNILKSVGKRGREEWGDNYRADWRDYWPADWRTKNKIFITHRKDWFYVTEWTQNNPFLDDRPVNMSLLGDKRYLEEFRRITAEYTAENLRWALIKDNRYQREHEWRFWHNQDDDMVANICNSMGKMNKYQFGEWRNKISMNYADHNETKNWKILDIFESENDTIHMDISINFTNARFGYETTMTFSMAWKLKKDTWGPFGFFGDKHYFKITRVIIGGGCTEFGTVEHKYTSQGHRNAIAELNPKNNPSVSTFFKFFLPEPLKLIDEDNKRLPFFWLYGLDPKNATFVVCDYRVGNYLMYYTANMFIAWYHKFNRMWHTQEGDKHFAKIQMIDVQPDKIAARLTMRLQIGVFENATVREWDFLFKAGYNKHGDEKWYIERVEVLCSPYFDLQDESFKAIRDVVTKDLMTTYVEHEKPVYFYSTIEFVQKFTENGVIEAEICDTGKVTNLTHLKFPMQNGYKFSLIPYVNENYFINTTLSNFTIDYDHIHLPARDEDYFTVYTLQTPYPPDPRSKTWGYEQEWKFYVKWHKFQQYYYIDRMEVACKGDLYISGKKYEPVDIFLRM